MNGSMMRRLTIKQWLTVSCLAAMCLAAAGVRQPIGGVAIRPPEQDFKYISPEVARLELYEGPWIVTQTHFGPRGKATDVSGTEEIRWILDRRAVQRVYTTSTDTGVYRAVGLFTWNTVENVYASIWFDNASTAGPMIGHAVWNDDRKTMTYTYASTDTTGAKHTHKVIERFTDDKHREATTYRVDGDDITKQMVVKYRRTMPCPAKVLRKYGIVGS